MRAMLEKLLTLEQKYDEINTTLMDPEVLSNNLEYQKHSKEQSDLRPIYEKIQDYKKVLSEIGDAEDMIKSGDGELRDLAREELEALKKGKTALEDELKFMLLPKDPRDDRNVILEIRGGTGGEEAALFAASLFRMYSKYAEARRWKIEVIDSNPTGLGGLKEIVASIIGKSAYSRLKYESGVHRVQRVPATEAQGRIHTSAATVAVLPEAEEVDVKIEQKDLRIDVFRSSGPGGQSVNTTDSAVRITHIPTGLVVSQQDQKSQLQNKLKAMEVLRARLLDARLAEQEAERSRMRKTQVGTGDRSAKIRTYNYPQNRVTDHRINFTIHELSRTLEGELDPLIEALAMAEVEEKLGGTD